MPRKIWLLTALVGILSLPGRCLADEDNRLTWEAQPDLVADPATVKGCSSWHNNVGRRTCEEVREIWGLSPETFSRWNPSISLDCEEWLLGVSYCVWVMAESTEVLPTATTTTTTTKETPSTTTTTAVESPTSWDFWGCVPRGDDDSLALDHPVLENDETLTLSKCQNACLHDGQPFAGVIAGMDCWCSDFVGNNPEDNSTECNIPCRGKAGEMCGGARFFAVYEAMYRKPWLEGPIESLDPFKPLPPIGTPTPEAEADDSNANDSNASDSNANTSDGAESGAQRREVFFLYGPHGAHLAGLVSVVAHFLYF